MPFDRPTLDALQTQTEAELASRLGLPALLPRSVLLALARVQAGVAHGLHGHLAWVARQILPDTADGEVLERHASIWGITRKPATFAEGTVIVTGALGAHVPTGARLQRADGLEFEVGAEAVLELDGSGTQSVDVFARAPGAASDTAAGLELSFTSPVAGVQLVTVVEEPGLEGGADPESDDALRERLLQRLQSPPQGGAEGDWIRWALEVPGVTRAWAIPHHMGLGTVGVPIAADDDPSGPAPSQDLLDEVLAYLESPERKPVTATPVVFAPTLVPLDPVIQLVPDTPLVRNQVVASLEALLLREGGPGSTLRVSRVREAISTTPGELDHVLVAPAADLELATGELAVLGDVTWQ